MKKISKNTLLLGGAIALGALCFIGAQHYFRSYLSNAEQKLINSYEKKQVIVAKTEIPAGAPLSEENLAVRSIPQRYLSSTALVPDDLEQVAGQKLMVPMKPGDPIDRGALERMDRAALSTTVEKGERAITFPVDEISSISGMLVPGDIIDLMFTGPGRTANSYGAGGKEMLHVRALLQSVPVIATGKTTQKRTVQDADGQAREVAVDFTTVTLKLPPAQAEQVLLGQKLGQLTAVLRNPDDKAPVPPHQLLDEVGFKQVVAAPSAAAGNQIEMIIGGSGGAEKVQAEVGKTLLASLAPQMAATPAPAAKPAPSAADVQSRLGIAPAAPASRPTYMLTTKP